MATTKKNVTAAAASKTAKTKPAAEKKTAKTTATTEKKSTAKKTVTADNKKTTASKTPAKRSAKKTVVTIDSICEKIEKKISKTNVASIKESIAVDIEVWGFEDGSKKMYIEVKDGNVTVAPFTYDAKDFRVSISVANAIAFGDGKIALKDLLSHDEFYAEGNIAKAVKMAAIF